MIANLIGGFVSILIGSSLVAPISLEVNYAACSTNASYHGSDTSSCDSALYNTTSWGSTVLKLVPGFFALSILGIGIAVTYTSLREAGIV